MALYLYGMMRRPDGEKAAAALAPGAAPGGPPRALEVRAVAHADVCALVTPISTDSLKLRRDSALAHADTLQALFRHGPVLPVRFGTVLPDEAALERDFLAPRAGELLARLEALDGMAEMQVKATYLEEPLLRTILAGSPALAEAAVRIRQLPPAATHFDRISLGEAIHAAVQSRRQQDAEQLIDDLRPLAVTLSVREPRHEREVLNASFLVADDRLEAFDAEVERLSQETAAQMQFKLIGPMPAHSFAAGELQTASSGGDPWD